MTTGLVQQAQVRTNRTKDSVCNIKVDAVAFSTLWGFYPRADPCDAKRQDGELLFANQCAIRVSHALKKAGVTFKSFPAKRKCWVHPEADHILAATELANWLESKPFIGCRKSENVTGADWRDKVVGRTGIICFEDYYSSTDAGGDHIDLWNKDAMTGPGSGLRARFGIVIPSIWSDFRKAKRIRFFPVD